MADDRKTEAGAEDENSTVRTSRRNFLKFSASGAAAAAVASWIPGQVTAREQKQITDEALPGQGERRIKLIVNGQEHTQDRQGTVTGMAQGADNTHPADFGRSVLTVSVFRMARYGE